MKQLILDLIPPSVPTLDNFVPGRNGEALKALLDAASEASDICRLLFRRRAWRKIETNMPSKSGARTRCGGT